MLTDPREQHIAAAFKAARPRPRMGWDDRALAALTDIRPRRHPNLLTFIIVAALILLLAAGVFAAVRHFFVEGTLQFSDKSESWLGPEGPGMNSLRVLSGELEWQEGEVPAHIHPEDISSTTGEVLFSGGDPLPVSRKDILRARLDGSDEVNLTETAGLGGINCKARWSPDESMIAFQHCDPIEGMQHCEVGFHVWVMNSDGTDARQVTPEGPPPIGGGWGVRWSPEGSRLLTVMAERGGEQVGAISIDIWTREIQVLPDVGGSAAWSPDGSMIVSIGYEYEQNELGGMRGQWNQLLLTNADGSDPRVLVEQFIVYAEVGARYPTDEMLETDPSHDWTGMVQWAAGPRHAVWSPASDKIAFLAALPFDPDGPYWGNQVEVWVYDLDTDELIRITNDDVEQSHLSWE